MSRTKTPNIPTPLPLPEPNSARVPFRCMGYLRPYWRMTLGAYLALAGINALAIPLLPCADTGTTSFGS